MVGSREGAVWAGMGSSGIYRFGRLSVLDVYLLVFLRRLLWGVWLVG